MKKWMLVFSMLAVLVLISVGCASSKSNEKVAPSATRAAITASAVAPQMAPAAAGAGKELYADDSVQFSSETASSSEGISGVDHMVVRTGNLQLVVKDIAATLDSIVKIAADNGGYVVTSQQWKENERNLGSISIRVLAENYDKSVAALRALAVSVTSESTSSQDVTQEYTDLNSKLKNLEAAEVQLLKIMENATKTEDVLAVQSELTNVRGEIEQTKGRMQYLERTSSTSLIDINLTEAVFGLKFSADKVRVNNNEAVSFIPEITGGFEPFSYFWDFGDDESSTEVSPHHVYKKGGDYSVVLTVTDDKGYTNEVVRERYISVQSSWNAGSVASAAWNALKVFTKVVANVLIWVAIFAPVWIIIGVIIWLALYLKKRKSRRTAEKKPQSQDKAP